MVKIRLLRIGAKKKPKYRIVVSDEQSKRDGKFIEILGRYNPTTDPSEIDIDTEKYAHWLSVGAQPTKAVFDIVKRYEKIARIHS